MIGYPGIAQLSIEQLRWLNGPPKRQSSTRPRLGQDWTGGLWTGVWTEGAAGRGVTPLAGAGTLWAEPSLRAMPAPSTDQGPRQTLMNFRATPDERQQMQALAVAHGTTLSDLIRRGLQLQGFEPQR
jgi:hypothetical protein